MKRKQIRGLLKFILLGSGALCTAQGLTQPEGYVKSHLSVIEGLSQNEVTSISEDSYGFLWFGTRGGLNRYDGYSFRHFKPTGESARSLQNPSIERLSISPDGRLWIGTKSDGFSIYDPLQESFSGGSENIPTGQDRVISFLQDLEGGLWFGSFSNGLVHKPHGEDSIYLVPGIERAASIVQTPDSVIWIGSAQGLFRRDTRGKIQPVPLINTSFEITEIVHEKESNTLWMVGWGLQLLRYNYKEQEFVVFPIPYSIEKSGNTYSLIMDRKGILWIGTWGGGLFRFNPDNEEFNPVDLNRAEAFSNVSDFDIVLDIYEDKQGIIWIGTDGGGIVKFSPSLPFHSVEDFGQYSKAHVNSITKTKHGMYLIGTRGQGLFASPDLVSFEQIEYENPRSGVLLEKPTVYFFKENSENSVWVGTNQGPFLLRAESSGPMKLERASSFFDSPDLEIPRKVLAIMPREGALWMATQQQGLYLFRMQNGQYKLVKHFTASGAEGLKNDRVSNLLTDARGKLWIGTYNGLFQYREKDSTFIPADSLITNSSRSLCNIILTLRMDANGSIWFGTPCSLNRLDEHSEGTYSLSEYTIDTGLPDDYISNILPDDDGNIWISTNSGISKLIRGEEEFQNFEVSDGTGEYTFSEAAGYKSADGRLYFGGFAGITHFNPGEIKITSYDPPVVITRVKVLNSEVMVGESTILPISINELEKLRLTYKEREVSIEFAALDYKSPMKNQYSYKLEKNNEEAEWIYIGKRREVSLQNLDPGSYILTLRGTNSNGLWSLEGRQLTIEVVPAPWESWYAIIFYVLIILGIVVLIVYVSLKQERLRTQAHLEHINLEKEKQLNEYKLRFFTNISHEFRTPLSLILAPINDLIRSDLSKLNSEVAKKIQIVYKNANKLLNLVNELLEFRRIEVGKARLEASSQDFIQFCREIIEPFSELAEQKGVALKQSFAMKKAEIYFDQQKMIVVFNNLLSNAFKYCGNPGVIEISVSETREAIVASVSNNGKSIPDKEMPHIFDRFYHISSENYQGSSGIGLALVKSYIEMHSGTVEVSSVRDGMTTFTIKLLKGNAHLDPGIISDAKPAPIEKFSLTMVSDNEVGSPRFYHHGTRDSTILIVEDNMEVIQYLRSILSEYYTIEYAMNGREGFDKATQILPDLVISDVMMPEMDGFELCKKIRNNEKLSHLPVILLTAKDTSQDILFGVKKGADAYITKPFDTELLMEKVKQLLLSRTELSRKFSKKILLEPTKQEITSEDEKFLSRALKYVEENIKNPELNLEDMAKDLAMSSATMYRKMKSLLNQSPGEFIRTVRFKRASQLLRDTKLTISEIIEMVGYQDTKRFRENFRNEFGVTPGEYREQSANDSN